MTSRFTRFLLKYFYISSFMSGLVLVRFNFSKCCVERSYSGTALSVVWNLLFLTNYFRVCHLAGWLDNVEYTLKNTITAEIIAFFIMFTAIIVFQLLTFNSSKIFLTKLLRLIKASEVNYDFLADSVGRQILFAFIFSEVDHICAYLYNISNPNQMGEIFTLNPLNNSLLNNYFMSMPTIFTIRLSTMVVSCIDIIRRFVQIMNSNIEKTLKIANNNDKLHSEIDMVIQIYEDITDVIRLFQQNYGALILILQCYCMFVTINQLFYLYGFGLSFKNGSILFKLMLIVFAMLHSLQLLLIAKAAKYLQHEGNRTKHLWYRFNFLPQNLPVAIEKSVEEMKLHMVLNPIAIELCGMFTLNYFILYAVIATGAEYLVMLIQFDIGSSKFAKGLN